MTTRAERYERAKAIFDDAVERPEGARAAFLGAACAGDAALRAEVEALLAADAAAPSLLDAPLGEVAVMAIAAQEAGADEATGGPTPGLPPGYTLGDYAVLHELGRGGMATVYLARDAKHDRPVALKTLHPGLAPSLGPARFTREIRVAARLQHPHVLPVLDSGETDGRLWFTMPYVAGETLRARLRRQGPLPIGDVVRTVREVAQALAYAHGEGVVHRDIKPENVLLSGGVAVVADFGVAKAVAVAARGDPGGGDPEGVRPRTERSLGRTALTGVGAALGTPAYMAPEQAVGDPGADHRVDLYALGCVAYELLAGRPPFVADTPWRLVRAHLHQTPAPVTQYRPDTPPALAVLVMHCLAKDPDARPASAAAVLTTLDALDTVDGLAAAAPASGEAAAAAAPRGAAAARPASDSPMAPAEPLALSPRRRARRRRTLAALGLVLVGGGAAAVAAVPAPLRATLATLATLLTRGAPALAPRRVVVAPLENRTGDTTLTALGAMAADWVAQELMQTGEFEVVQPRTVVTTGALLAQVPRPLRDGDPAVALARETGAGRAVAGSMDRVGDSLRFQVRLVDVASGRLLRAVPAVTGSARAPGDAVAALARRTVAELAATVDTAAGAAVGAAGRPPSYAAYREVRGAWESFFRSDWDDFDARLVRAAALDSTYATPLLLAAWGADNVGRWAREDSLLRRVAPLDARLTPVERDLRDALAARVAADHAGALRAAQALLARSPGSVEVPLLVALSGIEVGRPRVALAALATTDPERGLNLLAPWYWNYRATALHQLGDHRSELAAARRARRQFPAAAEVRYLEVRALAALGRTADVARALEDDPGIGAGTDVNVDVRALVAARELRAHGHAPDADRVLATALGRVGFAGSGAAAAVRADSVRAATQGPRSTRDAGSASPTYRARLLYEAGRWADARRVFAAREGAAPEGGDHAEVPRDLDVVGQLGTIAARTGDRAGAARAASWLAATRERDPRGRAAVRHARILALLGDRAGAVAALTRATRIGRPLDHAFDGPFDTGLHTDPDLAGLRGYPPFEALLTPRP